MSHFPDLAPCTYFDGGWTRVAGRIVRTSQADYLCAVGWLDRGQPFETGAVSAAVFRRLFDLAREPWQPAIFMGWHSCDLCWRSRSRLQSVWLFDFPPVRLKVGACNLFVPGDGFLYAAPSMILHYIARHRYRPPAEFGSAVLACPPVGSAGYLKAIAANGPPEFAQFLHQP